LIHSETNYDEEFVTICTLHKVALRWSNQRGWDGQEM